MSWNHKTKYVCIDTETTGVERYDYPFAVSLCDDEGNTLWFEWEMDVRKRKAKINKKDVRRIEKLCRGKELVFHNQNFDVYRLDIIGCKLDWRGKSWDTMYLSHIWDSGAHTELNGRLKELCLIYLDFEDDDQFDLRQAIIKCRHLVKKHDLNWSIASKEEKGDHIAKDFWLPRAFVTQAWEYVPDKEDYDSPEDHPWYSMCERYGRGDTERTMALFLSFWEHAFSKWEEDDKRFALIKRERRFVETVYDIQEHGIHIFQKKATRIVREASVDIIKNISKMEKFSGKKDFNPESPYHMSDVLFNELKFPTELTNETKSSTEDHPYYATNKHVRGNMEEGGGLVDWMEAQPPSKLNRQRQKFMIALEDYKQSHVVADYVPQYIAKAYEGTLYALIKANGTATTRMSSSNPNGQNINARLRAVFGPSLGNFWYCLDYSQLQLRIFAYVAEERSMIEAFEQGYDFHGFVGSRIYGIDIEKVNADKRKRTNAKTVNFGYIFGEGIPKIAKKTGIPDIGDLLKKNFPNAFKFMESTKRQVYKHGYITTPHGYRLYCNQPHKGVNYIVQGCEGDIVKEGMNNCHEYLKDLNYDASLMFNVHDENLFRFAKPKNKTQNIFQQKVILDLQQLMELPGEDFGMKTPVDIEHTTTIWKDTVKGVYSNAS